MPDKFVQKKRKLNFCGPGNLLEIILVALGLPVCMHASDPKAEPTVDLSSEWTILHTIKDAPRKPSPVPEDSRLEPLDTLDLEGLPKADINLIGHYGIDGDWGVDRGWIRQTSGSTAALKLATAEDFEFDGQVNAAGLGGWFLLFGWRDNHGYIIYNVQLKTSTSPWLLCEIRGGEFIPETHRELTRYSWGGSLVTKLSVQDKRVTLRAGKRRIASDVELPNYHAGDVIIGTYKSQYGPKKLRLGNLRIRAK